MNIKPPSLTRKILIVDDDERLRDLLSRYFTDQGFQVFTAEDSKEMSRQWQREYFDLVVLDVMMPGEDGLSICRRMRGGQDDTPVIMLTAEASPEIIGTVARLGVRDYVTKPFDSDQLLDKVIRVVNLERRPEA